MQGLDAVHYVEDTVDERLSFPVTQTAQRDVSAQMGIVVRIAARAAQGALLGDLNGKRRGQTLKDFSPRADNFRDLHTSSDAGEDVIELRATRREHIPNGRSHR